MKHLKNAVKKLIPLMILACFIHYAFFYVYEIEKEIYDIQITSEQDIMGGIPLNKTIVLSRMSTEIPRYYYVIDVAGKSYVSASNEKIEHIEKVHKMEKEIIKTKATVSFKYKLVADDGTIYEIDLKQYIEKTQQGEPDINS